MKSSSSVRSISLVFSPTSKGSFKISPYCLGLRYSEVRHVTESDDTTVIAGIVVGISVAVLSVVGYMTKDSHYCNSETSTENPEASSTV